MRGSGLFRRGVTTVVADYGKRRGQEPGCDVFLENKKHSAHDKRREPGSIPRCDGVASGPAILPPPESERLLQALLGPFGLDQHRHHNLQHTLVRLLAHRY